MRKGLSILLAGVMATSLFGCSSNKPKEEVKLTIAAAASLENAFEDELIPMFEKEYSNVTIEGVYDSSGKLQLQIEKFIQSIPIFLSSSKSENENKLPLVVSVTCSTPSNSFNLRINPIYPLRSVGSPPVILNRVIPNKTAHLQISKSCSYVNISE